MRGAALGRPGHHPCACAAGDLVNAVAANLRAGLSIPIDLASMHGRRCGVQGRGRRDGCGRQRLAV